MEEIDKTNLCARCGADNRRDHKCEIIKEPRFPHMRRLRIEYLNDGSPLQIYDWNCEKVTEEPNYNLKVDPENDELKRWQRLVGGTCQEDEELAAREKEW